MANYYRSNFDSNQFHLLFWLTEDEIVIYYDEVLAYYEFLWSDELHDYKLD